MHAHGITESESCSLESSLAWLFLVKWHSISPFIETDVLTANPEQIALVRLGLDPAGPLNWLIDFEHVFQPFDNTES